MEARIIAKGSFLPQNIEIVLSPKSKRQTTGDIEEIIAEAWLEIETKAKNENQMLWNGEGLRLDNLKQENDKLILYTSPSDFKTHTCLGRNINKIEKLGMAYFSAGLIIGGFVETSDNYFIFIDRSTKSISRSRIDFIGGIMDKVNAGNGLDLLSHSYQEIEEEINITQSQIESNTILGLVLCNSGNVIIVTSTKLKIKYEEVMEYFSHKHDEEVQDLVKVEKENLANFVSNLGSYRPAALQLLDLTV